MVFFMIFPLFIPFFTPCIYYAYFPSMVKNN
jgi:hypothetical protein